MSKTVNDIYNKITAKIPKKYNQLEFLKDLGNDNYNLYVSMTSAGDGKTHNVSNLLCHLAFKGYTTLVISETWDGRSAMLAQIMKLLEKSNKRLKFIPDRDTLFLYLYVNDVLCFKFADLDHAVQIKNASSLISDCSFIWFDEFLKLGGMYSPYQYEQFELIYARVARTDERRKLKTPKIILTANPDDFSSPLLQGFDLYSDFAKMKDNTIVVSRGAVIETRTNEIVNEENFDKTPFTRAGATPRAQIGGFTKNDYMINHLSNEEKQKTPKTILHVKRLYIIIFATQFHYTIEVKTFNPYNFLTATDEVSEIVDDVIYLTNKYYNSDVKSEEKRRVNRLYMYTDLFSATTMIQAEYLALKLKKFLPEFKETKEVLKTYDKLNAFYNAKLMDELSRRFRIG
jgi:hypothetical protein